MVKTKEILIGAREILEDPNRWNRNGQYVVDRNDHCVPPWSSEAAKFCVMGAIKKSSYDLGYRSFDAEDKAREVIYAANPIISKDVSLITFNDQIAEHEQILELFDNAIKHMDAKEVA